MLTTHQAWKNDIPDVRSLATAVATDLDNRVPGRLLSATDAAAAIAGAMAYVATHFGFDTMQRACVDLVRCRAAWETSFGVLPMDASGRTPEAIRLIAILCRGVLPLARPDNLKSALSFWAVENDFRVLAGVLA